MENINNERIFLSGKTVSLSEEDEKSYLTLVNRVCFYQEPNANHVALPADTAEQYAQTLKDQPVQAKYKVDKAGKPTLGGHEVYIDKDDEIAFDTESVGTHYEVWVEEDDVDVNGVIKKLPCLFAKQKIWKRHKNVCAAIKRLFAESGGLHNSWEIITKAYTFKNGIKTITDYEFFGNALLGGDCEPAYGKDAKILSLSSKYPNLAIAEALSKDMIESSGTSDENCAGKEEGKQMKDEQEKVISEKTAENVATDTEVSTQRSSESDASNSGGQAAEPNENNSSEQDTATDEGASSSEQEVASLTMEDLWCRVNTACREAYRKINSDGYLYASFIFPVDKIAWCRYSASTSELDFLQFSFEVADDAVTIVGDPVEVHLVASPKEINAKLGEKDQTITDATSEISSLKAEIAELKVAKEAYDKILESQAEEARIAEVAEFKEYITISGCFTEEEMASEEMLADIEALNREKIKGIISDRMIANKKKDKDATSTENKEASTKDTSAKSKLDLGAIADGIINTNEDPINTMNKFLRD